MNSPLKLKPQRNPLQPLFWLKLKQWGVKVLFACLALFGAFAISFVISNPSKWVQQKLAFALRVFHIQPAAASKGSEYQDYFSSLKLESYFSRPSIENLEAKPMLMVDERYQRLKTSSILFVSYLLAQYPDFEFYFLARDGEIFYDIAKALYPNHSKLHLLNVSRISVKSPELKAYLQQQGLFSKLEKGQKVLMVDTGYYGNIVQSIAALVPDSQRHLIKAHLVASYLKSMPLSHAFLSLWEGEKSGSIDLKNLFPVIELYFEKLPHYTDRSRDYMRSRPGGILHPVSAKYGETDGLVSKAQHLAIMQDLKWQVNDASTQKFIRFIFDWVKTTKDLSIRNDVEALKRKIHSPLVNGSEDFKTKGLVNINVQLLKEALFLDVYYALREQGEKLNFNPIHVLPLESRLYMFTSREQKISDKNLAAQAIESADLLKELLANKKVQELKDYINSQVFVMNDFLLNRIGHFLFAAPDEPWLMEVREYYLHNINIAVMDYLVDQILPRYPDLRGRSTLEQVLNALEKLSGRSQVLENLIKKIEQKNLVHSYRDVLFNIQALVERVKPIKPYLFVVLARVYQKESAQSPEFLNKLQGLFSIEVYKDFPHLLSDLVKVVYTGHEDPSFKTILQGLVEIKEPTLLTSIINHLAGRSEYADILTRAKALNEELSSNRPVAQRPQVTEFDPSKILPIDELMPKKKRCEDVFLQKF